MIDSLDRLSDRERDLLTLLAQGHTAKTIARSRSLSANVVNEHLRSARRKTGASSSRELARLVAGQTPIPAQEVRDKLFGVEDATSPGHRRLQQGRAVGPVATLINWRVMMIFGVLIAAGVLAYQTSVPGQAEQSNTRDPSPASEPATSGPPDVVYQVLFSAGDELLAAPTVASQFGRWVRAEIPGLMRVTMLTGERGPDGKFYTSATMQVFRDNAWQPAKEMSMMSTLASTPSFEHSVEGTPDRFVI
ncbi:MAG: helix-turn-helix transcriptional regulator, partial [Brevundimonas sp.]|nr:helix-turn-helix transcriptional regulator [Brevundimonas sp.]